MNKKVEGYWWSEQTPEYPKPGPNVLTPGEASFYCCLIQTIQNDRRVCKTVMYKGCSQSRITGQMLGCEECSTSSFYWPKDFATHYVKEHRVRPSDAFIEFLEKYVRDMKDKNLQTYFINGFKLYRLKKIEPVVVEESGMNEWNKYIDACFELKNRLKIPMNQAIRDVAECNNIDVGALAREMNRRSQITKRAKKAREKYKKGNE